MFFTNKAANIAPPFFVRITWRNMKGVYVHYAGTDEHRTRKLLWLNAPAVSNKQTKRWTSCMNSHKKFIVQTVVVGHY